MSERPTQLLASPIQLPSGQESTIKPDLAFEHITETLQKARIARMVIISRLFSGVVLSAREESRLETAATQSQDITGAVDSKNNLPGRRRTVQNLARPALRCRDQRRQRRLYCRERVARRKEKTVGKRTCRARKG